MPVITRLPSLGRPALELPDPTQRVVTLRGRLIAGAAQVGLALTLGLGVALAVLALVDGVHADTGLIFSVPAFHLALLALEWWGVPRLAMEDLALRRRVAEAEPLVGPVRLVRPRASIHARGLAAGLALGVVLIAIGRVLGDPVLMAGFAGGYPLRLLGLAGLVTRRERRDGRRYLERADLDEDEDLLWATPEELAELESA